MRALDRVDERPPVVVEELGGDHEHARLIAPASAIASTDVEPVERRTARLRSTKWMRLWVRAECSQIACGITVAPSIPAASTSESVPSSRGTSPAATTPVGRVDMRRHDEADQYDSEQADDGGLERPLATRL